MNIYESDKLITKNGNISHGFGFLKLESFRPFAKNPVIADVFRNLGWADELVSGMRNTYKYTRLYSGGEPSFEGSDIFICTVPLNWASICENGYINKLKDTAPKHTKYVPVWA